MMFDVDDEIVEACAGEELAKMGIDTDDNRAYCLKKFREYGRIAIGYINSVDGDVDDDVVISYFERNAGVWLNEALNCSFDINMCRAIAYVMLLKCYREEY